MGQYGNLPSELNRLMKRKDLQRDLEFYTTQRRENGVSSEDLNLSRSRVHSAIRQVFTRAKARAEAVMYSEYPQIRQAAGAKSVKEKAQQRGDYQALNQILNLPNGK